MSRRVVALMGASGRVGSAAAKHLLQAHEDGSIQLVLVNRPGSSVSSELKDAGVQVREVDLEKDSVDEVVAKLEGVEMLISAVGFGGTFAQPRLIEALARLSGFQTYVPPNFTRPFPKEDLTNPVFAQLHGMLFAGHAKARELGVGLTAVYTGVFEEYFMSIGFLGSNVNDNLVQANQGQLKNTFSLVTMDYLGAALAQLARQPIATIRNKDFSVSDLHPSGADVVAAFEAVNGSKPTIKDYTDADYDSEMGQGTEGAIKAGYMRHWAAGDLEYPSQVDVAGYTKKTLEEVARAWKK